MNVLFRWVVAIFLVLTFVFGWYISSPVIEMVIDRTLNKTREFGTNTTQVETGYKILIPIARYWAIIPVLAVLLWAFLAPREAGSYYE